MIDAFFWYTGLAAWTWIMMISFLSLMVAIENRLIIRRGRTKATR